MELCKWKITYNNPNHCSMMELAHTPTRPPWRPAASSITALKESNDGLPGVQSGRRMMPKSVELTVPPQHMSVSDLIAAMPKRQRMPKPQSLCSSHGLAVEPSEVERGNRQALRTPYAAPFDPLREHLESAGLGKMTKKSSEQSSKSSSVLAQAAKSVASSRSRRSAAAHGSQLASPASGARSLASCARSLLSSAASSVAASERGFSTGSHGSLPPSPPRIGACSDRASPASGARSLDISARHSPVLSHASTQSISPHRTTAIATSQGSTNARSSRLDTRGSSMRMNTADGHGNKNFPSRGSMGGSTPHTGRSRSSRAGSAISTPSQRSRQGSPLSGRCSPPLSGRCSPPTPPIPSSPSYSPF